MIVQREDRHADAGIRSRARLGDSRGHARIGSPLPVRFQLREPTAAMSLKTLFCVSQSWK